MKPWIFLLYDQSSKKIKNEMQFAVIVYEELISLSLLWFHNIRVVVQMRHAVIQSTMILYSSVKWIKEFYRQKDSHRIFHRDIKGRSFIFIFFYLFSSEKRALKMTCFQGEWKVCSKAEFLYLSIFVCIGW